MCSAPRGPVVTDGRARGGAGLLIWVGVAKDDLVPDDKIAGGGSGTATLSPRRCQAGAVVNHTPGMMPVRLLHPPLPSIAVVLRPSID
jgi:hypothetical protein